MAWVRIESSVSRHRKFQQAGPAASWLWLCGLAYCQEGLTDGFIPTAALPYLGVKPAKKPAAALVAAGLWHPCPGGWRVHDYLAHNREASSIRRVQDERRAAGAVGGRISGAVRRDAAKQPAEANAKQVAEANAKQPANPSTATATSTATDRTEIGTSPGFAVRNPDPVENLKEHLRMAKAELASAPADDGNFRVIARIARDLIQQQGLLTEGDLVDAVKTACGKLAVDYGWHREVALDVVHRACVVELFKAKHDLARQVP